MGGSSRFRKRASSSAPASFSLFSFFKQSRRPAQRVRDDSGADDSMNPGKVWPSDYDKGRYVAKPGIDPLASVYIIKLHETWVSESEREMIKV